MRRPDVRTPVDTATDFANELATAPGDLPMPEVRARSAAKRIQFRHDNTIAPQAPEPGGPVTVLATTGTGILLRRAAIFYTADGSMPNVGSHHAEMSTTDVTWEPDAGYITTWQGFVPPQVSGTLVRYRIGGWTYEHAGDEPDIWAHDGQGFWFRFSGSAGVTTFAFHVEERGPAFPQWARDAVIYHIFLDRFHPGTPDGSFARNRGPQARHGGTLRGVRASLPYVHDLGFTCIWLSPLAPSETYHRYDALDLFGIDSDLGTPADLKALIEDAHALGIRVVLDFVPNHCSWHHPAFLAAQADRDADTASWFTFDEWPERYRSFLQRVPHLPAFNTQDPGARAHLTESALFWITEFGFDGFRIDHAIGPSMDFWEHLRAAIEAAFPEVVTLGEATDTPDSLRRYRGRLSGILDFPLARALRAFFARSDWSLLEFEAFLCAYELYMRDGPGRASFLDNHDMNRFLFLAEGDRKRLMLGALCQFSLEPTPIVYYGTEIGMSQEHDRDAAGFGGDAEVRHDMIWDPERWDDGLRQFYRALILVRREQRALRQGTRRAVHLDCDAGTYAYVRECGAETGGPAECVAAVFNIGTEKRSISLDALNIDGSGRLLVTCGEVWLRDGDVRLPAMSGAWITKA